ncbi:hypothetical protein E4U53_005175 [Claviceps sorghi]|nr:hypothetical protein E4U53_005175 [Claviceps sorghi]
MLACILEELPAEIRPKPDNYFYKRHRDHAGFKGPSLPQTNTSDSQQAPGDVLSVKVEAPST